MLEGLLVVSTIVLWIAVALLAVLWVVMARQVGFIYRRLPPQGARDSAQGPTAGDRLDRVLVTVTDGRVDLADARRRLLVLVNPSCVSCQAVAPAVRTMLRRDDIDGLVLVTASTQAEARVYAQEHALPLEQTVGINEPMPFGVGTVPFAIALSPGGVVHAKGLVNSLEHLESLVDGEIRSLPTLAPHSTSASVSPEVLR